jgi:hypothetical protein
LFSKEVIMNRKSLFSISLAIFCLAITAPVMGGSALTFVSDTPYPLPYPDGLPAFNITAEGNLDWLIINENQKANANIIATQPGTNLPTTAPGVHDYATTPSVATNPPPFSFTDGQNPTSAAYLRSDIALVGVATDFYLPAGSGSLTFWWVSVPGWGGPSQFTLAFGDGTSYTAPDVQEMEAPRKTVINWQTDMAQTLHLSATTPAGFNAIAVSAIPEPGTLTLLGIGLLGLAYIWRIRK